MLSAVQSALSQSGFSTVTTVGHSLGAALALLDGVYLPLNLPSSIGFQTITYGLPRVGNQDFAAYVDANLAITHINNKYVFDVLINPRGLGADQGHCSREDPIPTVPGMFLGYHHPQGENHIMDDNTWVACPGDDNPSTMCSTGDVPTVAQGSLSDHDGMFSL